MAYKSFVPTPLPPKPSIELTEDMIKSLPTLLGDEDHGVLISGFPYILI